MQLYNWIKNKINTTLKKHKSKIKKKHNAVSHAVMWIYCSCSQNCDLETTIHLKIDARDEHGGIHDSYRPACSLSYATIHYNIHRSRTDQILPSDAVANIVTDATAVSTISRCCRVKTIDNNHRMLFIACFSHLCGVV